MHKLGRNLTFATGFLSLLSQRKRWPGRAGFLFQTQIPFPRTAPRSADSPVRANSDQGTRGQGCRRSYSLWVHGWSGFAEDWRRGIISRRQRPQTARPHLPNNGRADSGSRSAASIKCGSRPTGSRMKRVSGIATTCAAARRNLFWWMRTQEHANLHSTRRNWPPRCRRPPAGNSRPTSCRFPKLNLLTPAKPSSLTPPKKAGGAT